jgi:Rha family phage regulatory protein
MKPLVYPNDKGRDVTTSLIVAEIFGRNHADVLRDIRNLHCSNEFRITNFADCLRTIKLEVGESRQKYYEITKDGFSFLVMGYTGAKAGEFKEKLIKEFDKREALLKDDDYIINRALIVLTNRTKALEQEISQKNDQLQLQEHVIKTQVPMHLHKNICLKNGSTK